MTQHFKVEAKSRRHPAFTTPTQIITAIDRHLHIPPADRERPSATVGMQDIMRLIAERYRAKPFGPSEQVKLKMYIDSVPSLASRDELLYPAYVMLNLMLELPYQYGNEEKMQSPFDSQTTDLGDTVVTLSKEKNKELLKELKNPTPDRAVIAQILEGVTEVAIGYRNIPPTGVSALLEVLRNNPTVTNLDISDHNLDAKNIQLLVELLKNKDTLTHLFLPYCSLNADAIRLLTEALKGNKTLTTLDLSSNEIDEERTGYLAEMLSDNNSLQELCLKSNNVRDKGALLLAEALKGNETLKILDISSNYIGDKGAQGLAGMLGTNRSLTTLVIRDSPITRAGASEFTKAFESNHSLTELKISSTSYVRSLTQLARSKEEIPTKVLRNFHRAEKRNIKFQTESREKYERDLILAIEQSLTFMPGTELIAGYVGKAVPTFTKTHVDTELKGSQAPISPILTQSMTRSGILTADTSRKPTLPIDMPFINATLRDYDIVEVKNPPQTIIESGDKVSPADKLKIRDQLMVLFESKGLKATADINETTGFIVLEGISGPALKSLIDLPARPLRMA